MTTSEGGSPPGEPRWEAEVLVPDVMELLERMAEAGTPGGEGRSREGVAALLEAELGKRGARVARRSSGDLGSHLLAHIPAAPTAGSAAQPRPLALLAHMDRVPPPPELAWPPDQLEAHRLVGPGVVEMRGGIAVTLAALDLLRGRGTGPRSPLLLLLAADGEVGFPSSGALIREVGAASRAVLVPSGVPPGGGVVVRRRGAGSASIQVHGREARAGSPLPGGSSAVHEIVLQLQSVLELADPGEETAVNVSWVEGGRRPFLVAGGARARVDYHFQSRREGERLAEAIRSLRPVVPGCSLTVEGGIGLWPLEPTAGSDALLEVARRAAMALDQPLPERSLPSPGVANLAAATGSPTLDGLGPEGEWGTGLQEELLLEALPSRIEFLARVISTA